MAGKRRRSEEGLAVNLPAATAVSSSAKPPFIGALSALRSVSERVHAALVNVTASTESRRQQIEQQRLHQHVAADVRAAALQQLVCDEGTVRTSHLERQLVDTDNLLEKLLSEQSVLESPSAELTQSIALLPSVAVEADSIAVELDSAPVLHAISKFGVVFGAQPASMLFDKGFALLVGRDGVKNAPAAFAMFEDAAAQGNTTAMGYAAEQVYRGFGVKQDTARAQQMYETAARNGDLYSRARVIHIAKRVAEHKDAFSMLFHAMKTGHVLATFELGICRKNGVGCKIFKQVAAQWFQRSSDQGYAIAKSELAACYVEGTGVEKNFVKAAALYQLAANQGYAIAQWNLGVCFQDGRGVAPNPVQAVAWYQRAADQGCALAQRSLAHCYKMGVGVGDCSEFGLGLAVMWYRRAAEQGDAVAQVQLGLCFQQGSRGIKKDHVQAAMWFHRAADQGDAFAQGNLGQCFYFGLGVAKDFVQAVKWLTLAAAQGDALAHYCMGLCYTTGNGVEKNLLAAISSYQRAADLGNEDAKQRLAKIHAKMPVH
jgi:TPR repeat protein